MDTHLSTGRVQSSERNRGRVNPEGHRSPDSNKVGEFFFQRCPHQLLDITTRKTHKDDKIILMLNCSVEVFTAVMQSYETHILLRVEFLLVSVFIFIF